MRKRILLSFLLVGIVTILIAGCTSIIGFANTTSTPAPQTDSAAVTVTPDLILAETSTRDVVTAAPTLSPECSDLVSASGANQEFLNFVNDNHIVTRINGLANDSCNKILADQLNQLVKTSAVPLTPGLAQGRVYLISATTHCQAPDSAAPGNTKTDLDKFVNKMNQYQDFVYTCHIQISANASSSVGGEKLVLNSMKGPQTFSGNGNSVKKFSVAQGEYKFLVTYAGSGNFTVHITSIYGKTVADPFNATGPYSGNTLVNLPAGEYYMSIEASAPYLIKIDQS
jgi:hypothetical protein